jgi:hypothetical protein
MSIKNKLILQLGITIQPNKWNGGILWDIYKYQKHHTTHDNVFCYATFLCKTPKNLNLENRGIIKYWCFISFVVEKNISLN